MKILGYSKALVPLVVLAIMFFLNKMGITADTSIKDALTLVVTGGLVYLVPNKA